MAQFDNETLNLVKRLQNARLSLLQKQPFYALLLMHMRFAIDLSCETAYTDGVRIAFNLDFINELDDNELEFVLMHEVLHAALGHPFRVQADYDLEIFDQACDIVVNSNILYSFDMDVKRITLKHRGIAMHQTPEGDEGYKYTVEQVYDMLLKASGKQSKNSSDDKSGQSGCDSGGDCDDITDESNDEITDEITDESNDEITDEITDESADKNADCDSGSDNNGSDGDSADDGSEGDDNGEGGDEEGAGEDEAEDAGAGEGGKGKSGKANSNGKGGKGKDGNGRGSGVTASDLKRLVSSLKQENAAKKNLRYDELTKSKEQAEQPHAEVDDHSYWEGDDSVNTQRHTWLNRMINATEVIKSSIGGNDRGTVPKAAEREIEELKNPILDWRTILNDFVQEEINDYSFSPPDKRMEDCPFFLPDFNEKDESVKNLLFMVDTSGSMSDGEITQCYSEIYGAIQQFNGKLQGKLGFFDAVIVEPVEFEDEDEFKIIRPKGGGGTSFDMIFEYVNQEMQDDPPTSIIILTDGYAPFPKEASANGIPVLWIINNKDVNPPWGKVARLLVNDVPEKGH